MSSCKRSSSRRSSRSLWLPTCPAKHWRSSSANQRHCWFVSNYSQSQDAAENFQPILDLSWWDSPVVSFGASSQGHCPHGSKGVLLIPVVSCAEHGLSSSMRTQEALCEVHRSYLPNTAHPKNPHAHQPAVNNPPAGRCWVQSVQCPWSKQSRKLWRAWFQTQLTGWINIKSPFHHNFGQKILQLGYLYQRQAAQNMVWVLWCPSLPVLIVWEVSLGSLLCSCCDWLWEN